MPQVQRLARHLSRCRLGIRRSLELTEHKCKLSLWNGDKVLAERSDWALCSPATMLSTLRWRFSLCRSVLLKRIWTLLKCVLKQIITANDRVHDPGLCGCPRFNDFLLSPKRLILVGQTSNFVSPKWTFGKKCVAQTYCRPNDRTPLPPQCVKNQKRKGKFFFWWNVLFWQRPKHRGNKNFWFDKRKFPFVLVSTKWIYSL